MTDAVCAVLMHANCFCTPMPSCMPVGVRHFLSNFREGASVVHRPSPLLCSLERICDSGPRLPVSSWRTMVVQLMWSVQTHSFHLCYVACPLFLS